MQTACPGCEAIRDVSVVRRDEEYSIKGEEVTVRAKFFRCETCGSEFATPEQLDQALGAAYRIYRESQGILSPEDIVRIRKKYSASQKAFARILGLGELSVNGFEQGALLSKSLSGRSTFGLLENSTIASRSPSRNS